MNSASSTTRITAAIQRPGRRSGTASIRSGWALAVRRPAADEVDTSAGRAVDGGLADGPALDAPLGQDLLVGAVLDHRLDGLLQCLLQTGVVLGHRQAVR